MSFPSFAKALVAAVLSGVAPVATAAATSPQGVTASTGTASLIAAAIGGALTWLVPNGATVKDKAAGLVVTLKTDADTFLSTLLAGLPALVQNAAQAALKPTEPAAPIAVNNYYTSTTPQAVASDLMFKMRDSAPSAAPTVVSEHGPELVAPPVDAAAPADTPAPTVGA